MRLISFLLILGFIPFANAQLIDGFSIQMGPKMDFYSANIQGVEVKNHLDVSAGLFAFKKLNSQWEMHVGLVKHDASAKFQITVNDINTNKSELFYKGYVYPTYSSYQLALVPRYKYMLNAKTAVYGAFGLCFPLSKKLSREGIETTKENLVDDNNNVISSLSLTTYNNRFEPGFFLLRADAGLLIAIKEYLAFDLSVNGRSGTLNMNAFSIEYKDDQSVNTAKGEITTRGLGLGLNIGIRIELE